MAASFFFYDLETSGIDSRSARIMQFAGQRTDMSLKPIGEPVNHLIALAPDVLPDPDAILLTGITPQQTLSEGSSEAEFMKLFYEEVVKPDTIFVGFNSIRFDDEFMRFLHYRNFYDAYEWQWRDGCSRWDLLDVVRMTRALRPDGIKWPYAPDGKPANRLGLLSSINKLDHQNAHDALSDVQATIALARLIQEKQPDLFDFLLKARNKKAVGALVNAGQPFVYTSGRYSSDYLHTTVVTKLTDHPQNDAALVYDLRVDPTPYISMSVDELVESWRFTRDPEAVRLPVKTLKYNRCPAVAPLGVIKDTATQERLNLSLTTVKKHLALLKQHQARLAKNVLAALERLDQEREASQTGLVMDPLSVDERLYDGFIGDQDKNLMRTVRAADPSELSAFGPDFKDARLQNLLPLYKARNYPKTLTPEERVSWDSFCHLKLFSGGDSSRAAMFFNRLQELAAASPDQRQEYLLEELRLYGESILPGDVTG
ncbi:MAG TPA: exodeoxyribonuclease I [Candidatus Dormibacteraeota bacterium]|nr:exodeoxyribonuclease I [Candidatus Dormibacteraeota bacterium]